MDYKPQLLSYTKSLYEKSTRLNMNTRFVYKRILDTLETHQSPIFSIIDLESLKNIGPKTINLFKKDIFEHKITIKSKPTTKNQTAIKKTRDYVPAYRSASYAILKVLHYEDNIPKHLICHRSIQYTSAEFHTKDRYNAWHSMKTLLKKNLIFKDTKNYFLTETGHILCDRLFSNDSTIINTDINPVKLIIDSREMKSRSERLYFQSQFVEMGVLCETRCIQMGDFIWTAGEYVLDFIVERKCGSDLCSSLTDGRFNEQKNRMMACNIGRIFYIVENLKESDMEKVGKVYVSMMLLSLKCNKITVIETEDINETCRVIEMIDGFVKSDYKKYGDKSNMLRMDEYVEKGTKKKVGSVKDIFRQFMASVHGVNGNMASLMANRYGSFRGFVEMCKENGIENELKATEKEENVKFGKNVSRVISELIFGKKNI